MAITSFQSLDGVNSYTFPTSPGDQDFRTNFGNLLMKSTRTPGGDGGVSEYGWGRPPSPVGSVQFSIYFDTTESGRSAMQALRDAARKMADWGMGILTDTLNSTPRYCVCTIQDMTITEERHKNTDLFQKVQLTFHAPEPFWLTAGTENLWDSTYTWNSAINWGGSGLTAVTGSGSFSVTNNGSAYTLGRFVALVTGATPATQLIVRRTVLGGVKDELVYSGSLVQNDLIEFDSRQQMATLNGVDVLENLDFTHPAWLRVLPGSNTFEVYLDDSAAAISCTVRYLERYM